MEAGQRGNRSQIAGRRKRALSADPEPGEGQQRERAIRRRQLKALCKRLRQLQGMKLRSQALLLKLGEAKGKYRAAWRLLDIQLPEAAAPAQSGLSFQLNRVRLREARRREGRYLLRTNLSNHR